MQVSPLHLSFLHFPPICFCILTQPPSLPQIEHKVKVVLDHTERKLASLPELPDNIELEIHRSLANFHAAAQSTIDSFTRHLNLLPKNFRDCLLFIKPKFILLDQSDIPVHEISDDDDDHTPVATPTKRPRQMPPPQTPAAKRQRGPSLAPPSSVGSSTVKPEDSDGLGRDSPVPRPAPRPGPQQALQEPFEKFKMIGKSFRTLAQVREEIESKTKAGLPQRNPDEVYEDLVKEAIKPWSAPALVFLEETTRRLQKELVVALVKSFESLKKRHVFKEARKHLDVFIRIHSKETAETLMTLYEHESRRLMTFNNEAFDRYKAEELHLLTRFRHKMRMEKRGLQEAKPLPDWDNMSDVDRERENKCRSLDENKIGKDQFSREVDVIAYVRGYYKLAALRFADAVAQRILCQMVPNIKADIHVHLIKELGITSTNDKNIYLRLMEEDPQMAETRQLLKREQAKYVQALASIDALKMDDGPGTETMGTHFTADVHMENGVEDDVGDGMEGGV